MDCSSSFEDAIFAYFFPELVLKLEFSEDQRIILLFFVILESFYGLVLPDYRVDICEERGV
jgi:hypothetical protein